MHEANYQTHLGSLSKRNSAKPNNNEPNLQFNVRHPLDCECQLQPNWCTELTLPSICAFVHQSLLKRHFCLRLATAKFSSVQKDTFLETKNLEINKKMFKQQVHTIKFLPMGHDIIYHK